MDNHSIQVNTYREHYRLIDVATLIYMFVAISGNTAWYHLYLTIGLYFVWIIILFISKLDFVNVLINSQQYRPVLWFLLYTLICGIIGGTIIFSLKQLGSGLIAFSPIVMFLYYFRYEGSQKQRLMLRGILIIWLFYSIKSIVFFSDNVGAARILASDARFYGDIAIGGAYVLAYGSAILAGLAINLILDRRVNGYIDVILWILIFFISIILVFMTESTVTLISMLVGIIYTVIFRNKKDITMVSGSTIDKKIIRRFLIFALLLIVFLLSREFVGKEIAILASNIDGIVGRRLLSFGNTLAGIEVGSDSYALNRVARNMMSLKSFFSHPLFGVCYQHGNGYDYHLLTELLGNHCEWSDALGNCGLIGGVPFLTIFIRNIRNVISLPAKISNGWIVTLLMLGLFNPFRAVQPYLVVFFIVPLVANTYQINTNNIEE